MSAPDDAGPGDALTDHSGDAFTELERKRLRKLLQDDDRATWLRRQVRVLTPWLFAVIGGLYGAWNYIAAHWKTG